ncbi:MAG TPA: pilus assembly protein TadG-related protein [Rhizomicrobium sp.]|nr:pilus assembly protein TadG-related protein [Rhizomicrobium sp.]
MFKRFLISRSGNISILSAVMMVAFVGVAGLASEYGNGLLHRVEDQRAADSAAIAGATVYSETSSTSSMGTAATNAAALNGVSSGSITSSLVSSPTGDGNSAVEVTVSSNAPLFFARLLQPRKSSIAVRATAYAEVMPGRPGCIIALKTTGSGVTASGGTAVSTQNCTIASNQTVTCSGGASLTADYIFYYSAAPSCINMHNTHGGTPTEKQILTADPLGSTSEVTTQIGRLSTVEAITSPTNPATVTGVPSLAFAEANNVAITAALASKGCTGVYLSPVWTVTCPLGGTYQFGTISVSGGATVNFNTSGSASNTYYFTQIATGSGTLNFGPGTYNVPQGIVTTNGSAVTTFGAGTFNIGASSSVSCNSSTTYSICNTGPAMTFAGPSKFVIAGGIYAKGNSTLTLGGNGSTNSYNIGKALDGNSLYMGSGSVVSFGDATGSGDVFQLAGNMNDPNGGTCLKTGAAAYHDVNGYFLTAGGNILGSGIYTVANYVSLGGSNGGNVTCWGTSTGVSGSNVTMVIGGSSLDASGHAFYVGAGYSTVTLTAPTLGSTQNLAVIGPTSSGNSGTAVFTEGATNTSISGAFYIPNGAISLSGAASLGNGSGQCLELIGSQISLSGGSSLGSICQITGASNDNPNLIALVQ